METDYKNKLLEPGDEIWAWTGYYSERINCLRVQAISYKGDDDKPPGLEIHALVPSDTANINTSHPLLRTAIVVAESLDGLVIPLAQKITTGALWKLIEAEWEGKRGDGDDRAPELKTWRYQRPQPELAPTPPPEPSTLRVELSLDPDIVPLLRELAGLLAGPQVPEAPPVDLNSALISQERDILRAENARLQRAVERLSATTHGEQFLDPAKQARYQARAEARTERLERALSRQMGNEVKLVNGFAVLATWAESGARLAQARVLCPDGLVETVDVPVLEIRENHTINDLALEAAGRRFDERTDALIQSLTTERLVGGQLFYEQRTRVKEFIEDFESGDGVDDEPKAPDPGAPLTPKEPT